MRMLAYAHSHMRSLAKYTSFDSYTYTDIRRMCFAPNCNTSPGLARPVHSQKERYKTVPFKVQVAVTGVVPWRVQFCTSSQRYNIVPSSFVPFKGQFCTSRNICTHCNEGKKCTLLKASSGYCPKHSFGGLVHACIQNNNNKYRG